MLILSKFKDYYDVGASAGVDTATVYERTPQLVEGDGLVPLSGRELGEHSGLILCGGLIEQAEEPGFRYNIWESAQRKYFVVGFCGHEYLCMALQLDAERVAKPLFVWKQKELDALGDRVPLGLRRQFGRDQYYLKRILFRAKPSLTRFQRWRVPAYLLELTGRERLILNPRLRDSHFQRRVDPWTAFQEISMFVSGVLGSPTRPMLETSDEVRMEAKGHDRKISFRKAKQEKKKR